MTPAAYDPAADPVHGSGWNSAARWGGWSWREPRYGEHFRTCSFCGCIQPEDLAAETAGTGPCRTCGQQGWDACFRSQQPRWADAAEREAVLREVSGEERARVEAMAPAHQYDPGGWHASWADRKYGFPHKFYVENLTPRDPSLLHCLSSSTQSPDESSWGRMGLQWHRVADCPPELLEVARADGMRHSAERLDGWLGFGTRASLHAKFYTVHLADPQVRTEVKERIEDVSGLAFRFSAGGGMQWGAPSVMRAQSR